MIPKSNYQYFSMGKLTVRDINKTDKNWIKQLLKTHWSSTQIVSRGKLIDAASLPGFVAIDKRKRVGLLTYQVTAGASEIVTLNSLVEKQGVGTQLVERLLREGKANQFNRVWVITTNDNLEAIRFYQKRGFRLKAIYPGAIERSRRLKPQIPHKGYFGIPIRDEIELECLL